MSEERKPLWPWIVALLIGLPLLYLLSWFPLGMLSARGCFPGGSISAEIIHAYAAPIRFAYDHRPDAGRNLIARYWRVCWVEPWGIP